MEHFTRIIHINYIHIASAYLMHIGESQCSLIHLSNRNSGILISNQNAVFFQY